MEKEKMTLQVLVATMHQNDHSLLTRMNICSDVIVGNQCDRNEIEEFDFNGHHVKWLSFAERGVGLNRNNSLMRADADICLFADDDVVYNDDYSDVVLNFYKEHPDADVVVFNLLRKNDDSQWVTDIKSTRRVSGKDVTGFGTVRVSIRNSCLKRKNIVFHREFGGGAAFSHGEDSLFLKDCARHKLRIYTSTDVIGKLVESRESTWFCGYNEKYFVDTGVLFYMMVGKLARFAALYHCLKHKTLYKEFGWKRAYRAMREGIAIAKSK